jgi:hypothetical protein
MILDFFISPKDWQSKAIATTTEQKEPEKYILRFFLIKLD